jgi:hypothetical protein
LRIHVENASSERGLEAAFASFVQQRADALFVGADSYFLNRRDQLEHVPAELTRRGFP